MNVYARTREERLRSAGAGEQTDRGPGWGSVDLASAAVARQWNQSIGQAADGAVYQHVAGGKGQREAEGGDRGLTGAAGDGQLAGRRPRLGAQKSGTGGVDRVGVQAARRRFVELRR